MMGYINNGDTLASQGKLMLALNNYLVTSSSVLLTITVDWAGHMD